MQRVSNPAIKDREQNGGWKDAVLNLQIDGMGYIVSWVGS